jgi:hypothetical protein
LKPSGENLKTAPESTLFERMPVSNVSRETNREGRQTLRRMEMPIKPRWHDCFFSPVLRDQNQFGIQMQSSDVSAFVSPNGKRLIREETQE